MNVQNDKIVMLVPCNGYPFLIVQNAVAEDLIVAHRVAPLTAAIGGVTLVASKH